MNVTFDTASFLPVSKVDVIFLTALLLSISRIVFIVNNGDRFIIFDVLLLLKLITVSSLIKNVTFTSVQRV